MLVPASMEHTRVMSSVLELRMLPALPKLAGRPCANQKWTYTLGGGKHGKFSAPTGRGLRPPVPPSDCNPNVQAKRRGLDQIQSAGKETSLIRKPGIRRFSLIRRLRIKDVFLSAILCRSVRGRQHQSYGQHAGPSQKMESHGVAPESMVSAACISLSCLFSQSRLLAGCRDPRLSDHGRIRLKLKHLAARSSSLAGRRSQQHFEGSSASFAEASRSTVQNT